MKFHLLIILFCFIATQSESQSLTDPLNLTKAIFSRNEFPNLDKHITGEFTGHPNGTDIQIGTTTKFLLLEQNEKTAVVNVTLVDSIGNEFDSYIHLKMDTVWKITAFRALAMTGMIYQMHKQLESLAVAQVDSVINSAKNDSLGPAPFTSKDQYTYLLENTNLINASDNKIIEHFKNHESEFNTLKNSALLEIDTSTAHQEQNIRLVHGLKQQHQSILISSVSTGGFQFGSAIEFRIGGIMDNQVGYLFVPENGHVPQMDPKEIILIREIGNGWYLYKTT